MGQCSASHRVNRNTPEKAIFVTLVAVVNAAWRNTARLASSARQRPTKEQKGTLMGQRKGSERIVTDQTVRLGTNTMSVPNKFFGMFLSSPCPTHTAG